MFYLLNYLILDKVLIDEKKKEMQSWLIVIIVIVCLVLLYLLSALVLFLMMKRAMDKAYDALVALVPYEKERMAAILKVKERLQSDGYHLSDEMVELTENNQKLLEEKPVDVSKVKSQTDFLIMYYTKFIKEKKVAKKDISYEKESTDLLKMLHLHDDLKTSPYGKYDKAAFRYNSYLGLIILAPFVRRKYQNAPIL